MIVPVHMDEYRHEGKARACLFMGADHLDAIRGALIIAFEDRTSVPREMRQAVEELWSVVIRGEVLETVS